MQLSHLAWRQSRLTTPRLSWTMQLVLLWVVLITSGGMAPSQGSLLQLTKMIKQATGRSAVFSYLNYGCHCGPGGKGQPKDATDWCCKIHDCCYKQLKQQKCHVLVDRYNYRYHDGDIQCCGKNQCEKEICQCDKEFALCLKRNLGSYQKSYHFFRKSLCQDENPEC